MRDLQTNCLVWVVNIDLNIFYEGIKSNMKWYPYVLLNKTFDDRVVVIISDKNTTIRYEELDLKLNRSIIFQCDINVSKEEIMKIVNEEIGKLLTLLG